MKQYKEIVWGQDRIHRRFGRIVDSMLDAAGAEQALPRDGHPPAGVSSRTNTRIAANCVEKEIQRVVLDRRNEAGLDGEHAPLNTKIFVKKVVDPPGSLF